MVKRCCDKLPPCEDCEECKIITYGMGLYE